MANDRIRDEQAGELIRKIAEIAISDKDNDTIPRLWSFRQGPEFRIQHALAQIENDFNLVVGVKPKALLKFGRSEQVSSNTYTTLMELPSGVLNENYVSDNLITTVSSSNVNDTQEIVYEGHTIDDNGDFTFFVDSFNLNGQTQVTLPTACARATRAFNNGSVELQGDVAFYRTGTSTNGVPDTSSEVHLVIRGTDGRNQSFKSSTTVSKEDYWIITKLGGGVEEKTSVFADIELEIRLKGKIFRERFNFDVSTSSGEYSINLDPCFIVPANSDVRLRALSSANNTVMSGFINGYLAKTLE